PLGECSFGNTPSRSLDLTGWPFPTDATREGGPISAVLFPNPESDEKHRNNRRSLHRPRDREARCKHPCFLTGYAWPRLCQFRRGVHILIPEYSLQYLPAPPFPRLPTGSAPVAIARRRYPFWPVRLPHRDFAGSA